MNPVEVGKFNPAFDIQKVMDYDDAMYATLTRIELLIKNFVMFNSEKYLRILALLNLKYNPIDNYDGVEKEDTSYDGTESVAHTVDANKLDSTRITGPAKDISITTGIDGKKEVSFSFDSEFKKKSVVAQTSDTENGKVSGTPSIDSSGAPSTSSSAGTEVSSKNYTTTYDDSTEGRLKDYTSDEGSVANSQKGVSEENMAVIAEITAGNPNNPSYTDSKSFTNRTDGRSLKKWGNMGVTTSQQMIN